MHTETISRAASPLEGPAPRADSAARLDFGPWRGRIEKDVERALTVGLLDDPRARAEAGTVLRRNNYRVTARVTVPGLGPVLVKAHRPRGLGERLLSLVRSGRARREYDTGRYLAAQGLPAPRPFAYGEQRAFATRSDEFFAGAFHDDVKTFYKALLDDQPRAMRVALLERAARLVRAMHDRGFDHRDLHAGNVLVKPGPGDQRGFLVVDLHRTQAGVVLSQRARVRGLAQWIRSLAPLVGPGARMRIVRAYAGPGEDARAFFRRMERVRRRMNLRARSSRGKRCFKDSTRFTRDVGEGSGARARDLTQSRLDAVLSAHDLALASADERVAKTGRKRRVTAHGDVVVKESLADGWLSRAKDALAPHRHRAGYANAHRLAVHHVGAARALGYVRRRGRSFSVFEDVSRAPRIDHVARDVFATDDRAAQRRLLRASADWMADLHRRGVYHGDTKGVNVRVDGEGPSTRFLLIDTDHCRFFGHPVDARRRAKNLAQLAASIPRSVSRTDRLRWYRHYARGARLDEREMLRLVAAQLARKRVVVDEPLE